MSEEKSDKPTVTQNVILTKKDLAAGVYKKVLEKMPPQQQFGRKRAVVTEAQVTMAVNTFFEEIASALICGDRVELRGFASMVVHHRGPRVARDPRTNQSIVVPARGGLRFRHSRHKSYNKNTVVKN